MTTETTTGTAYSTVAMTFSDIVMIENAESEKQAVAQTKEQIREAIVAKYDFPSSFDFSGKVGHKLDETTMLVEFSATAIFHKVDRPQLEINKF